MPWLVAWLAFCPDHFCAGYETNKLALIPDVDQVGDTCWLVGAANNLAGAGWGSGATAQVRGDSIYGQLTNKFGTTTKGGRVEAAMTWWLQSYGCSGQSPYYNITFYDYESDKSSTPGIDADGFYEFKHTGGAVSNDYRFLVNELNRCQFVSVDWYWSTNGHCMALAAGDNSASVWRDGNSPRPPSGPGNDVTTNSFDGSDSDRWHINSGTTVSTNAFAMYGVTLCPGKPHWAVQQYDVRGILHHGTDINIDWIEEGEYAIRYDDPVWDADQRRIHIDNERFEDRRKELYLDLTFHGATDPARDLSEHFFVGSTNATIELSGQWHFYNGTSNALAKYLLNPQPEYEYIEISEKVLPLLKEINIATYCVPEPCTLSLLLMGVVLCVLARAWRNPARRKR